jgi:hypothetical protein
VTVVHPDDIKPHWDVLSGFRQREGIAAYQPPVGNSPDRSVLEGGRGTKKGRAPLAILVTAAITIAGAVFNLSPRTLPWAGASLTILAVIIVVGALVVHRPRGWRPPRLAATTEGLTVTDVIGVARTVAWADMGRPRLTQRAARYGRELRLEWTEPSGERQIAVLGDTVEIIDVYDTIRTCAPPAIAQQLHAKPPYENH